MVDKHDAFDEINMKWVQNYASTAKHIPLLRYANMFHIASDSFWLNHWITKATIFCLCHSQNILR